MPLIVSPLPNEPFGVGMTASLDGTEWALAPETWKLDVTIRDVPETGRIIGYGSTEGLHTPIGEVILGRSGIAPNFFWQAYPQFSNKTHGDPVTLTATLSSLESGLLHTETITVEYDVMTGLQIALPQLVQAQGTGSGLTPTQAQQLEYTMAYASFQLGGFLPGLPDALAALLPLGYGFEQITPDRVGQGELNRPTTVLNTYAFGIAWQFRFVPPGIGLNPGAPPSYDISLLELGRTRRTLSGGVWIDDSIETSDSDRVWIWNMDMPHSIRYSLAPGVEARFYWVILGGDLPPPSAGLHQRQLALENGR